MRSPVTTTFGVLALSLAVLMAKLRVQPEHPATAAEIEADGGKWVQTPDGRLIEYFTCGVSDGPWVYFQHGYGSTGKQIIGGHVCSAAEELGLQVFAPSQPGFGLSSTYPLNKVRLLSEWPADVHLIIEKENIKHFYISGISAGCVHAFTVAHAFSDQVLGVGVSTPTTPLAIEASINSQMSLPTRCVRTVFVYPYIGDLLGWLMTKMSPRDRMAAAPDVKAALDEMARRGGKWADIQKGMEADQARGMVKGFRGWADNMAILNEDLPFDVSELGKITSDGKRFVISTAPDDVTNPPEMQQWWAENVPGAELMHCDAGWGHAHAAEPGFVAELFKRMMASKHTPNSE